MPIIIATGSNIGDKEHHLKIALKKLSANFQIEGQSQVYSSKAVDYIEQADFYNQVLQFKTPPLPPHDVLKKCLEIEYEMGRIREVKRGPRTIDIDLIFYDLLSQDEDNLILPHPRLFQRAFVVHPLMELPFFETLKLHYHFKTKFDHIAQPIKN
jgi:2-amino-4-hydroxy-6-hydroxymethyldihydropteridine diphosphokinase